MRKVAIAAAGLWLGLILPLSFGQGSKGDAAAGKLLFDQKCQDCHDADTDETKTGPGLKGVKDGKLPSGMKATRDNILELVNEGRDEMPSVKDSLSDQEKENVIAYVLTL